jgi:hypothetical protein
LRVRDGVALMRATFALSLPRLMPFCFVALLGMTFAQPLRGAELAPEGARLSRFLDATHVEERWPAGVHVAWETGLPDGKPEKGEGRHTHCSAFVAAAAKELGIYILRPPEHGQALLANAQYDWLADAGATHGWRELPTGAQAQEAANRGELVVAAYRNHRDNKPGHIAIVRPNTKSMREMETEGPQITQAGGTNYLSTTLKRGFVGHPAAWNNGEVRYYAHAIDWSRWPERGLSHSSQP